MSQITRQNRTDANGEPVTVYYRDATIRRVYRYAADTANVWLYEGDTDKPLAKFATVTDLELALHSMAL